MSTKRTDIKLTSVDDLFKTQETREDDQREKITDIPLSELHPFKNHPFQVKNDEELRELASSIKQNGVVSPAIARPRPEGGYEILAGHRRKMASELAGLGTMPVVIRELDDDAATIVMVDSNQQRENVLPSEKAFSYKMRLEAMKRVAGRPPKENVGQVVPNFYRMRSTEILGQQSGENYKQVQRYIRLTNLIPKILKMVDEKLIAFNPAVELSYLPEEAQKKLYEIMSMQQNTPSLSQAQHMKRLSEEEKLDEATMLEMLSGEKPNQTEKVSIKRERFNKYFPKDYTAKQIEDTIVKLVEDWYRKKQREREQSR